MKLTTQAVGALLMTLQKCLAEQVDITELLEAWELDKDAEGNLVVLNPPNFKVEESLENTPAFLGTD